MKSIKSCALRYLNDWYQNDRGFLARLRRGNKDAARLKCINDIAKNYRVVRNFPSNGETNRLEAALILLDAVPRPLTKKNVDVAVFSLADKFHKAYRGRNISAASKLLWFLHKSPVVIYDRQAVEGLNRLCGRKSGKRDYADFREDWLLHYSHHEDEIRSACAELGRVKDFSLAHAVPIAEFNEVVGSGWFRERVFDKYLWMEDNSVEESPRQN
jgi:hypothetical protein